MLLFTLFPYTCGSALAEPNRKQGGRERIDVVHAGQLPRAKAVHQGVEEI